MRCCICECNLNGTSWLCSYCVKEYGLDGSVGDWPEWARFMRQEEENRRHTERRDRINIVSIEECAEAEMLVYGEINDDRL